MDTMTSAPLCTEYMQFTISPSDSERLITGLRDGTLDLNTVSMAEYLQISFLTLMSGEEIHIEQKMVAGGNVFNLHACVSSVTPSQPMKSLREKQ